MPNGNAVANLTVATSESWQDQQGQKQERTEWHRIVMYRKLAEIAGQYLRKGSKVYLEGKLQTRERQDQQGQKRYTTEIVADEMQMLDSKQDGQPSYLGDQSRQAANQQSQQRQPQQAQQRAPQQSQQRQSPPQQQRPAPQQQGGYAPPQNQQPAYNEPLMDFDDQIPF